MTNYIPIANVQTTNVSAFSLNTNEYLYVGEGIEVTTTLTTAVLAIGTNITVVCDGTISGKFGASIGTDSYMSIGPTGHLSALDYGIYTTTFGTGSVLYNAGSIFAGTVAIKGSVYALKELHNSGSIVAGVGTTNSENGAIFITSSAAANSWIDNSGLIQSQKAGSAAIHADGLTNVTVTNSGRIIGGIALGNGNDTVNTAAGRVAGPIDGGGGNDALIGSAVADAVIGGIGNDTLQGLAGNDNLNGGANNDTLFGGIGNDYLTGGSNNDIFVFNTALSASANRDTVTDFNHVADTFKLENAVFTRLGAGVHALNPAFFRPGTHALDANDYVVYNQATGLLSYDNDGSGAHAAIVFAFLANKPVLAANDFLVI
jgi:Ca2+-binding RTX toxin-like protein